MKIKTNREKTPKSTWKIFCDIYKEFAENTSIHGLKYTVQGGISLYERLFWIFVVLSGISGAVYMTSLFWGRYTSNPTRTTIRNRFAPTTSVPFPAVTICNLNKILERKVDKFISNIKASPEDKDLIKGTLPQLLAFTHPESINYNMSDLQALQALLHKNNIVDVADIMRQVGQSCEEMFIKCSWDSVVVPCWTLFVESMTSDGVCCSFNYNLKNKKKSVYTPFNGIASGLNLMLNLMVEKNVYSPLRSPGFKVFLHSPSKYPSHGVIGKFISAYKTNFIQFYVDKLICSRDVKQMPVDQRFCLFEEEAFLRRLGVKYSDTNCYVECDIRKFRKLCNCVPFYYNFTGLPVCNISRMECLDPSKNDKLNDFECSCPAQCEDVFYNVYSTSSKLAFSKEMTTDSFFKGINITEEMTHLNIFFLSNNQQILKRDRITSTIYLLSSFGGVYSLFMGCSMLTLVEIVYFFFFRFFINVKSSGRVNKTIVETEKGGKHMKNNLSLVYGNYESYQSLYPCNVFIN